MLWVFVSEHRQCLVTACCLQANIPDAQVADAIQELLDDCTAGTGGIEMKQVRVHASALVLHVLRQHPVHAQRSSHSYVDR